MSAYVNQCRQKTTKIEKKELKKSFTLGKVADERMGVLCSIVTF